MLDPSTINEVIDARWIPYHVVGYLHGRGVVFGCGPDNILPHEASTPKNYNILMDATKTPQDQSHSMGMALDWEFDLFANGVLDYGFVGWGGQSIMVEELIPKIKKGGHLMVHAPQEEPILPLLQQRGTWKLKDHIVQEGQQLLIAKLLERSGKRIIHPPCIDKPTVCVCRFGAIGDMVMVTPLLEQLKKDGYWVTVNCTPYNVDVLQNNPHIDNVILQQRDAIPNQELGQYWEYWAKRYDKYVNLSESIEGSLLRIEVRPNFYTPAALRRAESDVGYIERTMEIGGYKGVEAPRPKIYLSSVETSWANRMWREWGLEGKKVVVWGLKGSSHHKVYPLMAVFLEDWLKAHPDVMVLTVGGEHDQGMEFDHPQVIKLAGRTSLRETMALIGRADVVVGPESAIVNIASCFPGVKKVVFLSHSSKKNLTEGWANTIALEPSVPCYPCHQMHHSLKSCPTAKIMGGGQELGEFPVCTVGVEAHRLGAALTEVCKPNLL